MELPQQILQYQQLCAWPENMVTLSRQYCRVPSSVLEGKFLPSCDQMTGCKYGYLPEGNYAALTHTHYDKCSVARVHSIGQQVVVDFVVVSGCLAFGSWTIRKV